jgi:hypothetical protein
MSASGFLQAKNSFCVGFANAGLQRAEEKMAATEKVSDDAHQKDKKRAKELNAKTVQIALLASAVSVGILFIV